ncbi:MAG: hypothetical protein N2447_09575 [Thermoanaerobaculum sp.]|nr:hypothetical protein [Thermoanaerobaculum sp.]
MRVVLESHQDGQFRGFLPRAGTWEVAVAGKSKRVLWNGSVDVPKPQCLREAWLELDLDPGKLGGKVVDRAGCGQEGVGVEVLRREGSSLRYPAARTGPDGTFRRVAAPGRLALRARDQGRAFLPVWVEVRVGRPPQVALVMEDE